MILRAAKGRHQITVTFELNGDVDLDYLKKFVTDALQSWGGAFHPDDPLFGSLENVNVTLSNRIPKS